MASGVNSTFRQVGIATGIAALGSIFANHVADGIRTSLAGTPAAGRTAQVADAVTNGQIKRVLAAAPESVRSQLAQAATSSFVDALNHITSIATVIALVAGILCLFLIRAKDFQGHHGSGAPPQASNKPGKHRTWASLVFRDSTTPSRTSIAILSVIAAVTVRPDLPKMASALIGMSRAP